MEMEVEEAGDQAQAGPANSGLGIEEIAGPSKIRVILQPNPGAPEVSVCMSVRGGANQDPPGAAGAHRMLAEMLAPGGYGRGVAAGQDVVLARGGQSESLVRRDLTTFCTTTPAVELPLALWVTGGRFTRFALSEENRKVALQRLADLSDQNDEDVFLGRAPTRLRQMAFLGSSTHAHPDLPNSVELDQIDLKILQDLHRDSFVAARAVVAISGGFDPSVAKRLVKEHLAPVRPGQPHADVGEPLVKQTTERFSMAEDASSKTPAVWYGWVAPSVQDALPLEVALTAAVGSSRLGRSMVGKGRAAKELSFSSETTNGPRLLRLRALGTSSRSLGTIEKLIDTELTALATRDLTDKELTQALEDYRAERAQQLATASARALALSEGLLRGLSSKEILAPLSEEVPDLSAERVRLAVRSFLVPERRSVVEVYPKGWQDPWQTPMPTYHIVSSGETLTSIARQHGTDVGTITKMNGISSGKPIFPGDKLRVPRGRQKTVKLRTHTVRRGDTLSGLAVRYGVSSRGIADLNGMSLKQPIRTGQTLTIPAKSSSSASHDAKPTSQASPREASTHVVLSGETLGGIAIKYGVRLSALATANGLTTKSLVRVGQKLIIPSGEAAARPGAVTYSNYTVKSGDTLSGIAKRQGTTVTEIERANGFNRKRTLQVGQTIKIPQKK